MNRGKFDSEYYRQYYAMRREKYLPERRVSTLNRLQKIYEEGTDLFLLSRNPDWKMKELMMHSVSGHRIEPSHVILLDSDPEGRHRYEIESRFLGHHYEIIESWLDEATITYKIQNKFKTKYIYYFWNTTYDRWRNEYGDLEKRVRYEVLSGTWKGYERDESYIEV